MAAEQDGSGAKQAPEQERNPETRLLHKVLEA
jgi:hypothetical protein